MSVTIKYLRLDIKVLKLTYHVYINNILTRENYSKHYFNLILRK